MPLEEMFEGVPAVYTQNSILMLCLLLLLQGR